MVCLLKAFARPDVQALHSARTHATSLATAPAGPHCLENLCQAVHGQRGGWTRLERFAISMTYPTQAEACTALGTTRATLIEQLCRLEKDISETLFHRATADGQPQRHTRAGTALLQDLNRPDLQVLRRTGARLALLTATPRPTPNAGP